MNNTAEHIVIKAAEAFSKQSFVFDELYGEDTIIQYKRKRVRDHVLSFLPAYSNILELNCGTGEDAIFFAEYGHSVHATDIASGMLNRLKEKTSLFSNISSEQCSYTDLQMLQHKGPYDLIFSNFGGLNCTADLSKVFSSFKELIKPNGMIILVIIPPFCLWEFLLLFKGQYKTAFRRFFSKSGRKAHVEGVYFDCFYHSARSAIKLLKQQCFEPISIEGLCTIVPPSYMEGFAEKHPRLFNLLKNWEGKLKRKRPWRTMGDYYILSMRRTC